MAVPPRAAAAAKPALRPRPVVQRRTALAKQAQGHPDPPLGIPIEGLYIRGAKPVAYGYTYTVLQ